MSTGLFNYLTHSVWMLAPGFYLALSGGLRLSSSLMRACIDIQPAVSQRAGIGRYVSELVSHLPADDSIDFDLFFFDFRGKAEHPAAPNCGLAPYRSLPGALVQQLWKRLGWPNFDKIAGKADVYHFTNFIIPPLAPSLKSLVSVHDISFMLYPEFAEKRNLDYLSSRIKATTDRADIVITISKQSAHDIQEAIGVSEDRIVHIYLGISEKFAPAASAAVDATRRELQLDRPYLLMVGTFEPRKNIPFAVELLEKMQSFDGDLVIVGQPGWNNEAIFQTIRRSPVSERIRTFTALADDHLVNLYTGASMLLMTSHYEGFGFPPLEAMACGTPVLTSSGGSLREVCGDAAIVLDGYGLDEWRDAAQRLLEDSSLREDLAARGKRQAAGFTWQNTADEHVAAYRKVLS